MRALGQMKKQETSQGSAGNDASESTLNNAMRIATSSLVGLCPPPENKPNWLAQIKEFVADDDEKRLLFMQHKEDDLAHLKDVEHLFIHINLVHFGWREK